MVDSGLPKYGNHRATVERRQRIAFEASGLPVRVAELEAAIEEYMLWEPGRAGHAEAHRKLRAALNAKGAPDAG